MHIYMHGYQLSGRHGKPGNVRKFDICHGNVRELTKSQENIREKSDQGKPFIADFTFGATPVFSRPLSGAA